MSDAESAEPFLNKDEAVWSQRRHHYGSRQRLILYILQAFTIFLLPISFYLGFQYSDKQHPRLPTDRALKYHLYRLVMFKLIHGSNNTQWL